MQMDLAICFQNVFLQHAVLPSNHLQDELFSYIGGVLPYGEIFCAFTCLMSNAAY